MDGSARDRVVAAAFLGNAPGSLQRATSIAVVALQHDLLALFVLLDVDPLVGDELLAQELLGAPAVGAPVGAVDGNGRFGHARPSSRNRLGQL